MNSYNAPLNSDNLLLQALMGKLQIHPPHHPSSTASPPFFSQQSIEDLLFNNLSDSEEDSSSSKTQLGKEESKLEKEIIRTILSGKTETLKPNSGQAVTIGQHNHICVGFHEDTNSDYRVWEWHGHIMLFDEEMDYKLEYIYGNYFERVSRNATEKKEKEEKKSEVAADDDDDNHEKVENAGLRELIESSESNGGRILHRHINPGMPRF